MPQPTYSSRQLLSLLPLATYVDPQCKLLELENEVISLVTDRDFLNSREALQQKVYELFERAKDYLELLGKRTEKESRENLKGRLISWEILETGIDLLVCQNTDGYGHVISRMQRIVLGREEDLSLDLNAFPSLPETSYLDFQMVGELFSALRNVLERNYEISRKSITFYKTKEGIEGIRPLIENFKQEVLTFLQALKENHPNQKTVESLLRNLKVFFEKFANQCIDIKPLMEALNFANQLEKPDQERALQTEDTDEKEPPSFEERLQFAERPGELDDYLKKIEEIIKKNEGRPFKKFEEQIESFLNWARKHGDLKVILFLVDKGLVNGEALQALQEEFPGELDFILNGDRTKEEKKVLAGFPGPSGGRYSPSYDSLYDFREEGFQHEEKKQKTQDKEEKESFELSKSCCRKLPPQWALEETLKFGEQDDLFRELLEQGFERARQMEKRQKTGSGNLQEAFCQVSLVPFQEKDSGIVSSEKPQEEKLHCFFKPISLGASYESLLSQKPLENGQELDLDVCLGTLLSQINSLQVEDFIENWMKWKNSFTPEMTETFFQSLSDRENGRFLQVLFSQKRNLAIDELFIFLGEQACETRDNPLLTSLLGTGYAQHLNESDMIGFLNLIESIEERPHSTSNETQKNRI